MPRDHRLVVCFVDDDPRELDIFRQVFGDAFRIVDGTRPDAALDALAAARLRPDLFVLDLYSGSGGEASDDQRQTMIRLKSEVDAAQARLESYLRAIGQGPEGGLAWLEEVRKAFPRVPAAFYTRKGTLEDAERCLEAGADDVIRKPSPGGPAQGADVYAALLEAARAGREALAARFAALASRRPRPRPSPGGSREPSGPPPGGSRG